MKVIKNFKVQCGNTHSVNSVQFDGDLKISQSVYVRFAPIVVKNSLGNE
jgi:hypothetical protein